MLIDKTPVAWRDAQQKTGIRSDLSIRSIPAQRLPAGKLHGAFVRIFFITMLCFLAACSAPPDEAALRSEIQAMQQAIEERSADRLLESVDDDFVGPVGMDHDGLQRYATLMLLRQQNVTVVIGPIDVAMFQDRATARFNAVVTGASRFIPEGVESRRVETVWQRDGDRWILISADWSERSTTE